MYSFAKFVTSCIGVIVIGIPLSLRGSKRGSWALLAESCSNGGKIGIGGIGLAGIRGILGIRLAVSVKGAWGTGDAS